MIGCKHQGPSTMVVLFRFEETSATLYVHFIPFFFFLDEMFIDSWRSCDLPKAIWLVQGLQFDDLYIKLLDKLVCIVIMHRWIDDSTVGLQRRMRHESYPQKVSV